MNLPPLVEVQSELTSAEISRYSRHLLIPGFGQEGQQRLKASRVLVVGAGGLGSPTLLYLAAAGVGTIGIVEFDVVEESNLQRQIIHRMDNLGKPKVDSAADAIRQLNPLVNIQLHTERLESSNVKNIFREYDLIVDGTDNFATRYLVNDACVLTDKPYVWGSIFRFEGQASVFWKGAPNGQGVNYRDLYPEPPPPQYAPSCSEGGVLGVLCASIASVMSTEVIKLITGIGESLLGRLLTYDALAMSYRVMPLRQDPERLPVTELVDYESFCGLKREEKNVGEDMIIIQPDMLKTMQDKKFPFYLIDVRELTEWNITRIEGAIHVPISKVIENGLPEHIPKDASIILYCKSGLRSKNAVIALQQQGFSQLKNLEGGIIAWAKKIDRSMPVY